MQAKRQVAASPMVRAAHQVRAQRIMGFDEAGCGWVIVALGSQPARSAVCWPGGADLGSRAGYRIVSRSAVLRPAGTSTFAGWPAPAATGQAGRTRAGRKASVTRAAAAVAPAATSDP